MTLEEAIELTKKCSNLKYVKASEYVDAFIFEPKASKGNKTLDGANVPVVLKQTGEVIGLTSYILDTYRDLEEELIKEYDVSNKF